jgi:hypothetical protein
LYEQYEQFVDRTEKVDDGFSSGLGWSTFSVKSLSERMARVDGLVHDVVKALPTRLTLDVLSKGGCPASIEGVGKTSDMGSRNHIVLKEGMVWVHGLLPEHI